MSKRYAELINQIRNENNMSREQFSEELSVSQATIIRWEKGVSIPSYESLIKIGKMSKNKYFNLFKEIKINYLKDMSTVMNAQIMNITSIVISGVCLAIVIFFNIFAWIVSGVLFDNSVHTKSYDFSSVEIIIFVIILIFNIAWLILSIRKLLYTLESKRNLKTLMEKIKDENARNI